MARNTDPLLYRDELYGFTLTFPCWWKHYAVIKKSKARQDTEYEVHFRFTYKGKVYGDIFTLLVFRMTRKEWVNHEYEDLPLGFLAENDGRVFAYMTPGELPDKFIDPKTGDYNYIKYGNAIRILKRMINQELPRIVNTLYFSRAAPVVRMVTLHSRHS
jgi:hypothetical protein